MDKLMSTFGLCSDQPYVSDMIQGFLFVVFMSIIESLLNIPFSIYSHFVIEEKYGFNKMTVGTFVSD